MVYSSLKFYLYFLKPYIFSITNITLNYRYLKLFVKNKNKKTQNIWHFIYLKYSMYFLISDISSNTDISFQKIISFWLYDFQYTYYELFTVYV